MKPDQFNVLTQQYDTLQKTLDTHIRDSDIEAKDNQDYRIRVVALEGQVEEFRKQLNKLESRLQDKMADVVAPMIESAQNLQETIDKKKTLVLPEKKKPWWKRW